MQRLLAIGLIVALAAGCGDGDAPDEIPPKNGGEVKNGDGNGGPDILWADEKPRVLIEAETVAGGEVVAPFKTESDADAAGGRYLTLPSAGCDGDHHSHIAKDEDPARTAGSASLTFSVEKEGDYYLWVRKWWCCACGDSFLLAVDDGAAFTFGNDGTTLRAWSWLAHRDADGRVKLKLTAGEHKLVFKNRGESGFRIDQMIFAQDPEYVPQGREQAAPAPAPGGGG